MITKKIQLKWYLLSISVPLLFVLLWHLSNIGNFGYDTAEFFEHAQRVYLRFKNEGFINGMNEAYFNRGPKSTFIHMLLIPFLFIAHGQVLQASMLISIFFFFIFSFYLYLIVCEHLNPSFAALTTSIITPPFNI